MIFIILSTRGLNDEVGLPASKNGKPLISTPPHMQNVRAMEQILRISTDCQR